MTSTRHLLISATGMVLSAGAGVAAAQSGAVPQLAARHQATDDAAKPTAVSDRADVAACVDDAGVRPSTVAAGYADDADRIAARRCAPAAPAPTTRPRGSTSVVTIPAPPTTPTTPSGGPRTTRPTRGDDPAPTWPRSTTPPATRPPSTTAAPVVTTAPAPTTTTAPAPGAPAAPTISASFGNLVAGAKSPVPSPDDPNRGFVSRLTVANPTGAAVDVKLSIDAATAAGFPRYLEAADLDTGALTCVTGSDMPYYKTSTTTATFVCTGSLPAKSASVITISSGSLIATSAVGQTVTIAAELTPGGANKTLQGTFAASSSGPTTTTTVAPTTTTVAPTTSTTLAPATTTTVARPTTTTTAVTVPASTTTTTAATGSTTSTTVAPTTTTSTTVAPTTTTTTAAPTGPAVSGSLANLKAGTTYPIASPDNPNRGFVGLLTVSNPTGASKVATVTVNASSPVAFPRYLEAADYDTGAFTCVTATNGAYYKAGATAATFTCTGTVAANAASVITVSSGSMIPATSVGQSVTLTATVNPGAATKTLQGTYA